MRELREIDIASVSGGFGDPTNPTVHDYHNFWNAVFAANSFGEPTIYFGFGDGVGSATYGSDGNWSGTWAGGSISASVDEDGNASLTYQINDTTGVQVTTGSSGYDADGDGSGDSGTFGTVYITF